MNLTKSDLRRFIFKKKSGYSLFPDIHFSKIRISILFRIFIFAEIRIITFFRIFRFAQKWIFMFGGFRNTYSLFVRFRNGMFRSRDCSILGLSCFWWLNLRWFSFCVFHFLVLTGLSCGARQGRGGSAPLRGGTKGWLVKGWLGELARFPLVPRKDPKRGNLLISARGI